MTTELSKWLKYTIDYEYGTATILTQDRTTLWRTLFYNLASDCFGIRKSIGEVKLIDEELVAFYGQLTAPKNSGQQIMNISGGEHTTVMLQTMLNRETFIDIPDERLELVNHVLAHNGDVICFARQLANGEYWKLKSESGDDWCTCEVIGIAELSCEVHHFWVEKHDEVCQEHKR